MADCFSKKEIKKYGLQGLPPEEQAMKIKQKLSQRANSKRQVYLQAISLDKASKQAEKHPKGFAAGVKGQLATDRWEMSATTGVEADIGAITSKYMGRMYEILEEFMPRKLGLDLRTKDHIQFLKAIRGEKVTDPKFKDFADKWGEVAEELRVRSNAAGSDIKKLHEWGAPIHHDEYLIGKKGFDGWYDSIIEKLDLVSMGLTRNTSRKTLKSVHDNMISGGTSDIKPGVFSGGGKVANRHKEERFFIFKDAESQLSYMEEFSDVNIFNAVTDYVSLMSTEIGLMERFGPNPDLTVRTLSDMANIKAKNINASDSLNKVYANISGKTRPTNRKFADRAQTIRNLETGLKLPGALLSAMPDVMFNSMTANYNGLPAMRVMTKFISKLTNSQSDRALAAKLHQPLQFMLDDAHSALRFADVAGHTASARFAGLIMRGSGLNGWTVGGKMAFHAEFMQTLAEGNFNSNLKRTFRRYGITEGDQNKINASKSYVKNGVKYFDPESIDSKLSQKIVAMVISETKYAVPEADALVRAVMNQGTRKGEVGGEILRGVTMFKTFPATIIANHWARALRGFEGSKSSRIGYASAMLISTIAIGALVFQLKEIAKGRKPIDWDSPELWKEAALAGGSFSIMGDIMSSNNRDYGNSIADFISGPIGADAQKIIWKGILGNMDDMRDSEKEVKNLPGRAVALSADFVPGQFWYSKLIMERMFLDSMRKLGDPNYDQKKRKRERKHYDKFRNKKWY